MMNEALEALNFDQYSALIALDMDGVVNGIDWQLGKRSDEGKLRRKKLMDKYEYLTAIELNNIDPKCAEEVSKVIREYKLCVVISSTWRELRTPEHFEFLFVQSGFPLPEGCVLGCTPIMDHIKDKKRGTEIQTWCAANGFRGKLIVIDDESGGLLDNQELIKTSQQVGFIASDARQLASLLLVNA